MPPPPRRRRPVEPATRVRLPRTARPRGEPASEQATERADLLTDEAPEPGGQQALPAGDTELTGSAGVERTGDPETQDAELTAGTKATEEDTDAKDAPADDRDVEAEPDEDRQVREPAAGEHVREPLLLPVCLGIVAVALGGLAVWFGLKSGGSPTAATGFGTGTGNAAVVDHAATAQVSQQIDNAVDTIFSYNYADTARTANAAKDVLTGPASTEYATLFKVVRQQAPQEKLVLTTTVTNSGVESLNGDTARLLIFANQKDTGATKASTTEAGAMFAVTAVKQDGRWKIYNIDTFAAPG